MKKRLITYVIIVLFLMPAISSADRINDGTNFSQLQSITDENTLLQPQQRDIAEFYGCVIFPPNSYWFSSEGYIALNNLLTISSGSVISASHTWTLYSVYGIRAILKNSAGESDWTEPHSITIAENQPPETPTFTGPIVGRVGVLYNFTVSITDPEGDQVYFIIDWGDGNSSGWLGPYDAGEQVKISHTWYTIGTYLIQVKAKDSQGIESNIAFWTIQIVELKKSVLIGVFRNQSQTDDLRIFEINFLMCIPSESFIHFGVSVVMAKEYRFGFIGSSFFCGVFEAAIL